MKTPISRLLLLSACGLTGVLANQANALTLPPYIGGTVQVTLTIELFSAVPTGDTVICSASLETVEVIIGPPTSSEVFTETSSSPAVISGSTATCTVTIPYLWTLANPSGDTMAITYTAGIYPTGATLSVQSLGVRTATHSLANIPVPPKGTVTDLAVTTRL